MHCDIISGCRAGSEELLAPDRACCLLPEIGFDIPGNTCAEYFRRRCSIGKKLLGAVVRVARTPTPPPAATDMNS